MTRKLTFMEKMHPPQTGYAVRMGLSYKEDMVPVGPKTGEVFLRMWDGPSRELIEARDLHNLITYDAGLGAARLFTNSLLPSAGQHNGLRMLAVGTGATGNLLSPDAPQKGQRKLNNEIERKAFSASQYRNQAGFAVSIQTNIVDYSTTFGEGEAVGPLNEMALLIPYSSNPAVKNPINNGPSDYDRTIDVSQKDLIVNYLTFSVLSKPSTAVLSIVWRLSF